MKNQEKLPSASCAGADRPAITWKICWSGNWPRHALSPPDRALCQELVYGMVRWQRTLDWLVARKTAGRAQNAGLCACCCTWGFTSFSGCNAFPTTPPCMKRSSWANALVLARAPAFSTPSCAATSANAKQTQEALEALKRSRPGVGLFPSRVAGRALAGPLGRARQTGALLEWNNTPPPVYARLNELKTDSPAWRPVAKEGIEFEERRMGLDRAGPGL